MIKRILIADDAAFMRTILKGILQRNGYEIVGEATNGNEAIRMYANLKPDVVTMDMTMPELSGTDALKEIVKQDPNAKVIMCSAMGQQIMVVEAIQAGAKDFIVKPFSEERILEALERLEK